ncbi:hypothetical protein NEIELOOT_02412 [Neisseria elongata subsp. glycolytica ATCC 29315]|uniref:Uncharacterized protein n=1 Tax=Neisseria elongata subsp. glycolytica ATCC 29315 TaxID=546263 RepID=D4DTK6_NEIEG|nr:hypothetical protein NEIELOOT_02412 [Neisseria elongata subsp. glycolytica ATCC 29315]
MPIPPSCFYLPCLCSMWSRLRIIRRRFERNEFFRRPPGIFERGRLKV